MLNIVATIFEAESEGYQAITTLAREPIFGETSILQMALIKRQGSGINLLDSFDSGIHTTNDTLMGGLIGALVGVLGGPLGMLLMGSYGALAGSIIDAGDALDSATVMEKVAGKLQDEDVALIALVEEADEALLDGRLSAFKVEILRYDAAVIADEVEEAREMEQEMERQARQQLRDTKKAERKSRVEEKRAKLSADFQAFKAKFKD